MKIFIAIFLLSNLAISETRWVSEDFFVETASDSKDQRQQPTTDCRKHIKDIMCLVDPEETGSMSCTKRTCLIGSEDYAIHFEQLYDAYPASLQKMFCHLDNIFIEKKFFGTAYAGMKKNAAGETVNVCMGIRKSVLDDNLNLTQWASWKEQLSFGGETENYKLTPGLPFIRSLNQKPVNDFLYFVIAHEFGHQFDFANGLNSLADPKCDKFKEECAMAADSFGALSWKTNLEVKPEFEFPHRKDLCFYWCAGKKVPHSSQLDLYQKLYNSTPFISTYATTQPWDDFADSLAYVVTHKMLKAKYSLFAENQQFDSMTKLHSKLFKEKLKYISEFLSKNDIKYPKD